VPQCALSGAKAGGEDVVVGGACGGCCASAHVAVSVEAGGENVVVGGTRRGCECK
jgi:hypothetical protein